MARPIRIEYEGAVYHVTLRGNERKPIFKTAPFKGQPFPGCCSKGFFASHSEASGSPCYLDETSTLRLYSCLVDGFLVIVTFQSSCDSAFSSGALSTEKASLTCCHTTGIFISFALFLMFTPCHSL